MSATIRAFLLGVYEFRSGYTSNVGDLQEAYDWGREYAHRATFRYFEESA